MAQYVVKSGDNLSSIASKLGLSSYNELSGYKSGNPSLIYPGEVLSYGGGKAPTSTKKKPAKKSSKKSSKPSAVDKLSGQLADFDKSYESPIDIYNDALSELGIADVRTRVTDLRGALMNTENMIRGVEESVAGRTADSLVTESQKQRLVGMEQEPLGELYRTQGQQFELASGELTDLMGQAETMTSLTNEGQLQERENLLSRLQLAIDRAKTKEEKKRWQKEFNLQKKKFQEDKRQFNANLAKASSSGGGGGSSGGSSGGGSVKSIKKAALSHFDKQWKAEPWASRQKQDAWVNAFFAKNKITDPEARQVIWDYINKTKSRPEDPTKDWLYSG